MKKFSKQEMEDAYMVLPQDIQQAISSDSVGTEVIAIGNEAHLHVDDMGLLNEEIAFVMLGLVKPKDFEQRLVERLSMESSKARNLVIEVNNRVFSPIRKSIIDLHHQGAEENVVTEQSRPVPMSTRIEANTPVATKPEMRRENILADIEDSPLTPKPNTQNSFVESKLTTPATTPSQKIVIGNTKKYSSDPYREPAI